MHGSCTATISRLWPSRRPAKTCDNLRAVMNGIYLAAPYDTVIAISASSAPAWNRLCMMEL